MTTLENLQIPAPGDDTQRSEALQQSGDADAVGVLAQSAPRGEPEVAFQVERDVTPLRDERAPDPMFEGLRVRNDAPAVVEASGTPKGPWRLGR